MADTLSDVPDFFGYVASRTARTPVGDDGQPIPWMTYPAISYLKQIDFSSKSVFEYGAGSSTLFWARVAREVRAVEHDEKWYNSCLAGVTPDNLRISLAYGSEYVRKVEDGAPHDVIVIDGRWRFDCAMHCLPYLNENGIIILDNSERYPVVTEYFRREGFIQIDFLGLGPLNRYVWATSMFLSRTVDLRPRASLQPHWEAGMDDSVEVKAEFWNGNRPGAFL